MENRRQLFAMMGAALTAGAGASANAAIPDEVRNGGGAESLKHPFGEQQVYFQGPTDQLKVFEGGNLRLKAGMEPHPPHKHPEEEIMLVTEGHGEISVEGKITPVGPGSMMYCAADKLHGVRAGESASLLFYYFKWDKR